MVEPDLFDKFWNYLDRSDEGLAWVERGLVSNAPQSAIDAFEEYKQLKELASQKKVFI